jgi:hypothetical protein
MEKGRSSWTREPLRRPFVAWNQVDAIHVAIGVPISKNDSFASFLREDAKQRGTLA